MTATPSRHARTVAHWTGQHLGGAPVADGDVFGHPLVRACMTLRAVGAIVDPVDLVAAELERRTEPGARVISVCCGAGQNERHLAARLRDRELIGIDLAPEVVEHANAAAERAHLTNVRFVTGDADDLDIGRRCCDAVVGIAAIHHIAALETFWDRCRRALRPGGAVLAQEYVGPSRMQWTAAQCEHGSRALAELVPDEHKTDHDVVRPPPVDVVEGIDPSEAVRSAEILPTCRAAGFLLERYAGAGGALLQPVLIDQIHTYDPRDWAHNAVLATLFREEDRLMSAGVLGDDFAMFVATPEAGCRG